MDNKERVRLFMAHMRQVRRANGYCVGCGMVKSKRGERCAECRFARAVKERSYVVDALPSTRAS